MGVSVFLRIKLPTNRLVGGSGLNNSSLRKDIVAFSNNLRSTNTSRRYIHTIGRNTEIYNPSPVNNKVKTILLHVRSSYRRYARNTLYALSCFHFLSIPAICELKRVPYSNRYNLGFSGYLEREEILLHEEVLNEYLESEITSPPYHAENLRATGLLEKIIDAVNRGREVGEIDLDHTKGLNWEVMTVMDTEIGIGVLYNGKILVSSDCPWALTDDEIFAFLIAHEVGHVLARHASESLIKEQLLRALWLLIAGVAMNMTGINMLICVITSLLALKLTYKYFSRKKEDEADYIGMMLMASAGYEPSKALDFFNGINDYYFSFLRTHPSSSERAKKLNRDEVMNKAQELYKAAIAGMVVKNQRSSVYNYH